jgi:hypothetical protein
VGVGVASAQPPGLERHAQVGLASIDGVDDECEVPGFGPCEWAARGSLVVTTGSAPVQLRVVRLEAVHDLLATPLHWTPRRATRVQLDTDPPQPARRALTIPANGTHTVGVLHAQEPLERGIEYRVTLEVDGQRVVVHASEHVLVRHPLP